MSEFYIHKFKFAIFCNINTNYNKDIKTFEDIKKLYFVI